MPCSCDPVCRAGCQLSTGDRDRKRSRARRLPDRPAPSRGHRCGLARDRGHHPYRLKSRTPKRQARRERTSSSRRTTSRTRCARNSAGPRGAERPTGRGDQVLRGATLVSLPARPSFRLAPGRQLSSRIDQLLHRMASTATRDGHQSPEGMRLRPMPLRPKSCWSRDLSLPARYRSQLRALCRS